MSELILSMTRREALALAAAIPASGAGDRMVAARKTGKDPWTEYPTRTLDQLPRLKSSIARNKYGGRVDRKVAPEGFFRTKQVNGRWWLVDPDGCLCIQPAVSAVRPGESSRSKQVLEEKFGNPARWAELTTRMLRENGFAALGAWSDTGLLNAAPNRLAWYTTMSFMGNFGKSRKLTVRQPGHVGFVHDCMPVFHPEFEPFCDEYARTLAGTRDDRLLVGHFSDNELPSPVDALQRFLSLDPAVDSLRPNQEAAAAWLKRRKGAEGTAGEITDADRESFREYLYDRYLKITTTAIRKYDPNHLCVGPRLWGPSIKSPGILRACGRYLDVIGANVYFHWRPDPAMLAMWRKESGRPNVITEFYARGEDSGLANTTGAGWLVRTQRDRGDFYQHFALGLLESRDCVGWQWLTYIDNDPQNAKAEMSNLDSNKGIVNIRFEPYEPLVSRMKALNEAQYAVADYFDRTRR